jgi:hypothetical protein
VDATVHYGVFADVSGHISVNDEHVPYHQSDSAISPGATYLFQLPSPAGPAHACLESDFMIGLP